MPDWQTMTALIQSIPDLPGARCVGEVDLYERCIGENHNPGRLTPAELAATRTVAVAICTTCPALRPCRTWLDGLRPTQRPRGVVAGQFVTSTGHVARRTPAGR